MKKILVTGATGFIGEHLTRQLASNGHEVCAYVRNRKKAEASFDHPRIRIAEGALLSVEDLRREMKGCDGVFHLAAYAKVWAPDEVFEEVNVGGTEKVLEAALAAGVQRVVITSTGGVFGPSGEGVTDESGSPMPGMMTQYERSKVKAEALALGFLKKGLEVVIVNPSRVYGPGPLTDSNGLIMVMQKYLKGKFRFLPGDGSSSGSYCYVHDVVNGHILAMEKGRSGERYLISGENASFREFYELGGKLAGKQRRLFGVPLPLLLGFARLQMLLNRTLGKPPLITPELIRKYGTNWNFSSKKAQRELGYSYISLEEGLRKTLDWLKSSQGM